jgi:hypothetical protein
VLLSISELLADVVGMAQVGLAQQTGTTIVWEQTPLPPSILVWVLVLLLTQGMCRSADIALAGAPQSSKEHLSHMLLNLLVFCVQASDGNRVTVRAHCDAARKRDKRHSPAQKLVLQVATQGLVLSADDLAAVFNPYDNSAAVKEDCWLQLNYAHVRLLPPCDAPRSAHLVDACCLCCAGERLWSPGLACVPAPCARCGGAALPALTCLALCVRRCSRLWHPAALGGKLTVQSDAASGTMFTASLPVMLPERSTAHEASSSDSDSDSSPSSPSSSRSSHSSRSSSKSGRPSPLDRGSVASTIPDLGPDADAIDTGLLPFLPHDMPPSESFDSMKKRGMMAVAADLVRAALRCLIMHARAFELTMCVGWCLFFAAQLLGNTPEAFLVSDGAKIVYVSPGAVKMLLCDSKEDVQEWNKCAFDKRYLRCCCRAPAGTVC